MLLRRFNWFESTSIQTNNHATSEPHTHVMSNENKFPLKVPFAEITCCGGVGLLRTGAPPAFANAQTGSTTGTAEGTHSTKLWSHLQEVTSARGKLCQHHGQHRQRLSAGQQRGLLGPSDGPHATASQALTPQEAHGRRSSNGRQGAHRSTSPKKGGRRCEPGLFRPHSHSPLDSRRVSETRA